MVKEIDDIISHLRRSVEFLSWETNNKSAFLAHIFRMTEDAGKVMWQIGYFNPDSDMITTFILEKDFVAVLPEEEVFREPGRKVNQLDISKITVSYEDAERICNNLQRTKYPSHRPLKKILILQNIFPEGNVWNITFFTGMASTLNIKINADNSAVISDKLINLINKML